MPMCMTDKCPCCREMKQHLLEKNFSPHCKPCWDRWHHGKRDNDWDPEMAPNHQHSVDQFEGSVVAIVGSRSITSKNDVYQAINAAPFRISKILSGGASGVDTYAEMYAIENGIPIKIFKPDWSLGKKAGPIRNALMLKEAEAVIAIWDGTSKGTESSIKIAKKRHLPMHIVELYGSG